MRYLVHEDRPQNAAGVRLAVASILHHDPDAEVVVSAPPQLGLDDWCRRVVGRPPAVVATAHGGWDVKPDLLLAMLDGDDGPVTWVDSDVICARSPVDVLSEDLDSMLVCEETWWSRGQGTDVRTTAHGWEVGRRFGRSVNSGVVRVTGAHREVLEAWRTELGAPAYRAAQRRPYFERPVHLMGDQEVLSGLLASTRFAAVPLRFLRAGDDIAQCFGPSGYTARERWRTRRRPPVFVHAMAGPKPWAVPAGASRGQRLQAELSPYTLVARGLVDEQAEPWLPTASRFGRLCRRLSGDDPALAGLPVAVPEELSRRARQLAGRVRRRATVLIGRGGTR